MTAPPRIVVRWDTECVRADVHVPGVGVIELNKFRDDPWYAMSLTLDGSGGEELSFSDGTGAELSPDLPASDLVRLLDVALGLAEFTCDCSGERCGSLRDHAVRVHREEKEYADRSLRAQGYTDCETDGCKGLARPGRAKCLGCDPRV